MSTETMMKPAQVTNRNDPYNQKLELKPGIDMGRLVGTPHLFAKFIDTREGFLIDPIAIMTLQPNGRIIGYSHPNEGSWIPYEHGTVGSDKAFAFITAMNTWIPSSTWQQSLGDIPVGYFCNEQEGINKLCLLPHKTVARKTKIVYLIASCYKFF